MATKFEHQLAKHKKTHVKYKNLKLSSTKTTPAQDPQEYLDGEIWRDAIYKQLNFEKLLVDFLTITILLESFKAIQRQVYDYNHPKAIFPWSKTVKMISTDKSAKVMLIYTFQVIEKEKFEYEHHGQPLAILNNIERTDNNNVVMQLPPPLAPAIANSMII